MGKFGNAAKVNASKETKGLYNFFVDEKEIFPSMVDLFHLCAAIGIRQDKRTPIADKDELINVYSIDKDDVFEVLMEAKYPELTGSERLIALQEYAETGIRYLKNHYDKEHQIDMAWLAGHLPKE